MTRKQKITFALAIPFLLWLVPAALLDRGPQPTWQGNVLDCWLRLLCAPFIAILEFTANHNLGPQGPIAGVALLIALGVLDYLLWACAAYYVLHLFGSVRARVSN